MKCHVTSSKQILRFTPVLIENSQLWSMWMTLNYLKTNFAKFAHYRATLQRVIEFFWISVLNATSHFVRPVRRCNMALYQIWSHLDHRKQSSGAKKLQNFLLCNAGKWAVGHSYAHQHGGRNMIINVWRFSKRWISITFAFIRISN